MKVVKITKSYRNGTVEGFIILLDEPYSDDDIQCEVEEWCTDDSHGQIYGYDYDWEFVEDPEVIKNVITERISVLDRRIEGITIERNKLINNLF